ncbi:MAG: prepilin-type N-terminal cleavage/methylation domain-containing protein [Verrucomicrobiota bacterium]
MMQSRDKHRQEGFSLVEVVLAIGIIAIAVVALLGLFGPTVGGVKQIVDSNRALSVADAVRQYINQDLDFSDITTPLGSDGEYLLYVWSEQEDSGFTAANQDDTLIEVFVSNDINTADPDLGSYIPDTTRMQGPTYIAVLRQLQVAQDSAGSAQPFPYNSAAAQAYIPFLVSIYQVDRNQFFSITPTGGNDSFLHDGNRITEYSMSRLRYP